MELFTESHLFYDSDAPRKQWIPRTKLPKTLCAPWLRLFSVELAFLTFALSNYQNVENCVVVYAGAAPGNHIPALASLWPKIPFYLYDPRRFEINNTPQIYIMKEKFTDQIAREWGESTKNVIFISDIRTSGYKGTEYEEHIGVDMREQEKWIRSMRPAWWSLEFRIPYPVMEKGEKYTYLSGWLLKQPFAKQLSTKMRLIGREENADREISYDAKSIEETMFYHNTVTRPDRNRYFNVYSLDTKRYGDLVFDNGYDFSYLLYVTDRYLLSPHAIPITHSLSEEDNLKFVKKLMRM